MFLYGGYDQHGFCCDELYQFSFFSTLWKKVCIYYTQTIETPPFSKKNEKLTTNQVKTTKEPNCGQLERYHHSAVAFGRSMFIFGGKGINILFNPLTS